MPTSSSLFSQPESSSISTLTGFGAPKPPSDLLASIPSTPWSDVSGRAGGDSASPTVTSFNVEPTLTQNEDKLKCSGPSGDVTNEAQSNSNLKDTQNKSRGRGFRSNFSNFQRYGGRNNTGYVDNRSRGFSNSIQQATPRRNYTQRQKSFDDTKSRTESLDFKEDYDFDKSNAELAEFLEKIDISSVS